MLLHMIIGCTTKLKVERMDGSKIEESELTSTIQSLMDAAEVAGLAISVFNQNKVVYKKAFGFSNLEKKDSLSTQTVFYGASFSKAVFGYLVAQLEQEGIIDLDVPLQNYLDTPIPDIPVEKEWRNYSNLKEDKRYEQITGRMCLSHTTGFPNWRWLSKNGEFLPEGKIHFLFDPGTRYSYSGEGMALFQLVIEKITGQGLEQLARERIFNPLGMDMTSYVWQERFEGRYCNGHTTEGKVIPKDTQDKAGAAGSMETTLEDYAKFIAEILRQTQTNGPVTKSMFAPYVRIKSKRQFGPLAWEDTDENDDIKLSYGLGWGLLQTPHGFGAFKEGHGEGFQHYSIIFPEQQIGVIILSNSDNGESIFKSLLEITIGDTYTPWEWENYVPFDFEKK